MTEEKTSNRRNILLFLFFRGQFSNWIIAILTFVNVAIFAQWFAQPTMEIALGNEISLQESFFGINFFQEVSIKNSGTKIGYIHKIRGLIRSKNIDQYPFKRKIETKYFYPASIPFLELSIMPNNIFIQTMQMYSEPNRVTMDSASIIQSLMVSEGQNRNRYFQQSLSFDVAGKTRKIIEGFMRKRAVDLKVGEYEYIIEFTKSDTKKPFVKCYSFIITPENITLYKESLRDFVRYYSMYGDNYRRPSVRIPISEINNEKIKKSLLRDLED